MYAKLRTRFPVLLATSVVAFFMAAPATWADDDDDDDDDETIPFEEAEVFFELNNTDGDLGIQAQQDGHQRAVAARRLSAPALWRCHSHRDHRCREAAH